MKNEQNASYILFDTIVYTRSILSHTLVRYYRNTILLTSFYFIFILYYKNISINHLILNLIIITIY